MARGLYVHIPFCVKKCEYCSFVSSPNGDRDAYITALCAELDTWRGEEVDSIFIGGGTPTSLDVKQLGRLLGYINDCFRIQPGCEWSVESNPKTLDMAKLEIMRNYGVNRLSVGVQSFSDAELLKIGRIHDAADAKATIELAKKAGFDNINIDLMMALPHQNMTSFEKTLDIAIGQEPEHISCYSLILEEETPLYYKSACELMLPDEDEERDMYKLAQKKLEAAGYIQYEISNFAKANRECRHNLKYWQCEEYIGAGLAAHSYVDGERFYNTSDFDKYIIGNRIEGRDILSKDDMRSEFIIMALRLRKGISEPEYKKRFGEDFDTRYQGINDKFIRLGLMERTRDGFRLTDEGISLSNSVMCEYV